MNLRLCQLLSSRLNQLSIQSTPAIRQHLNPAHICIRSKRTSTKPVHKSLAKSPNNLNQPPQTSPIPKPNPIPDTPPAIPSSTSQSLKHQVLSSRKAPLLNGSSSQQSYQTIPSQTKSDFTHSTYFLLPLIHFHLYKTFTNILIALPTRLLIYHSGTLTTTFIGIQKISSIFCFAFLAFFLSPSYAAQPEEPIWRPILSAFPVFDVHFIHKIVIRIEL